MILRKFIFFSSLFFLLVSCSKDESETEIDQQSSTFKACFELDKEDLEVGEVLQITNCTIGATFQELSLGNGELTSENEATVFFNDPGEYTINLRVVDGNGKIDVLERKITVNEPSINYWVYFSKPSSGTINADVPMSFGFRNNSFYFLEGQYRSSSQINFNYVEVDFTTNNFERTSLTTRDIFGFRTFLSEFDNGDALVSLIENVSLFTYRSKGIKIDANNTPQSVVNDLESRTYGSLNDGVNNLFYGVSIKDLSGKPSIEIRSNSGDFLEKKIYDNVGSGFIGDLEKTDDGYLAFGVVNQPNASSSEFLLLFLNDRYEYSRHFTFDMTSVIRRDGLDSSGSFHLEKLANNNYVLYGLSEFKIINPNGEELVEVSLPAQHNTQSIIPIGNEGFIISTLNFLHKYDLNGNLVKSLKFRGQITPNFVLKDDVIYFASSTTNLTEGNQGILTESSISSIKASFFGAVDKDLNLINLNE